MLQSIVLPRHIQRPARLPQGDDLQDVDDILDMINKLKRKCKWGMSWMSSRKSENQRRTTTSPPQNPVTTASPLAGATHSRTHAESITVSTSGRTASTTQTATNIDQMTASWVNPSLAVNLAARGTKKATRRLRKLTTKSLRAKAKFTSLTFVSSTISIFWTIKSSMRMTSAVNKIMWWRV